MSELAIRALAAALRENPVCRQILCFLMEHENAMDSARGIATCWVDSDEMSVRSALDSLVGCGVVTAYLLSSGTLYGLTRDPGARAVLRANLGPGGWPEPPPGAAHAEDSVQG